ncbi:MAG: flippase-like domain-containing protein [Syntrophomonadaceae bacterium]|jgi:uncharacterized protein (TIRG00374 family)|nr:flippase-like domain-containing protein [Syntrophomonadaceae bacterium]
MKSGIKNSLHKINWKTVARTIISAGLLLWLALSIEWKDLAQAWRSVELGWIMAAIAWVVISVLVSVRKWQLVLNTQGIHLSWHELWKSYWAGLFFNNFLPSSIGGDAMRIWWVGKTVHDSPGVAVSVVVERILATTGLAITGLTAVVFVSQPDTRAVILFVILMVLSLGLLGLICWGHLPRWSQDRKGKLISFLKGMVQHGAKFKNQPGRLAIVVILSVAFQLTVIGVNYCIFQALQVTALTWWDLVYVIPVVSVVSMLPVGINGYGLREGAYVVLLGLYQVPASTAFSASLLFVFLVSLCSLYGGYTWHNHLKGEDTDVKVTSITNSPGSDEIWE